MDKSGAAALFVAVVLAAGLEGGVEVRLGALALALAALASIAVLRGGTPTPGRLARVGLLLVAVPMVAQLLPIPMAVRRVIAPGQAAWFDRMGTPAGSVDAWLATWASRDLDAALGTPTPVPDLLLGATVSGWHPMAVDVGLLPWQIATVLTYGLVFLAGRRLGASEGVTRGLAVGLLLLGVAETILGLLWRDGPTTGLSPKVAHLGSATGTFMNRGHFAAFVILAIGAGWGLAGGLFPLEPEEVRRHRARRRRSSQPPSTLEAAGDKIPRLALLGFGVGLLSLGIVAANSRGPLVALALAGALVGVWTWRRREERTHLWIGLSVPIAGVALAVMALGPRGALGRFLALGSSDVSVSSRLSMWKEGIHALQDAPIFGAGLGAWRYVWPIHEVGPHLYTSAYGHQEYLQWAVEQGLVGLAGVLVLLVAYIRRLHVELGLADERPETAMAIGLSVGVVAVLLQSFADFPLHTPGVALPTALVAGLALGSAGASREAPPGQFHRAGVWCGAVLTLGLLVLAGVKDWETPGSRQERQGGIPALVYATHVRTVGEAEAWLERAVAEAAASPLDPWRHAAVAKALSMLVDSGVGGQPEERAYAAELALARALALRPRDPRLLVYLADARLRISRSLPMRDVFRADARALLVQAVRDDAWRAEAVFAVAEELDEADLAAIAAAAPENRAGRARVRYYHGKALASRGRREAALAEYMAASEDNPAMGQPAFEAGVVLEHLGREDEAHVWFERFFTAQERPGGMEGWAHYFLGHLEAAEMQFRRVVEQYPSNRWALDGLARVAHDRRDVRTERMALERMLALDPRDGDARARFNALEKANAEGGNKPASAAAAAASAAERSPAGGDGAGAGSGAVGEPAPP